MTDEKDGLPPAEALTVSATDLQRFIKAKGLDRTCSQCGEDGWMLPLRDGFNDGDQSAPVQLAALPGIGNNRSIPVHTLLCKSCGYIKLVHAGTVLDWVKENG